DQASLLIALLRASGVSARYVTGVLELPMARFEEALGLSQPGAVARFLARAGVAHAPVLQGGTVAGFEVEATWVAAYVPYTNYRGAVVDFSGRTWVPLAPALTGFERSPSRGVLRRMGLDVEGRMAAYLSAPQSESLLPQLQREVEAFLQQEGGGETFEEQLASRTPVTRELGLVPSTLPVKVVAVTREAPELAVELRHRVRFLLREGPGATDVVVLEEELPLLRLAGRRLTLSYVPATDDDHRLILRYGGLEQVPAYLVRLRPQLKLDGRQLAVGEGSLDMGVYHRLEIELLGPWGSETVEQTVLSGGYHALAFGAQRFHRIQPPPDDPGDTEYLAAQLLAGRAYDYGRRWDEGEEILAGLLDVALARPLPGVVIASNALSVRTAAGLRHRLVWQGVTLDAALRIAEPVDRGDADAPRDFLRLSGLEGSALEHLVFEETFLVDAVSADKGLGLTRQASGEVLVLEGSSGTVQLPSLTHPPAVKTDVAAWLQRGFVVEIPRHPLARGAWVGSAWRVEDPNSGAAGYFLSGGLAGGASTDPPGTWALAFLEDALAAPMSPEPNTDPQSAFRVDKVEGGDGQEGEVGEVYEEALTVKVTDAEGRPVQGAEVVLSAIRGGGKVFADGDTPLSTTTVFTDAQGLASVSLESGPVTSENPVFLLRNPDDEHRTRALENIVEAAVASRFGPLFLDTPFRAYAYPTEPVSMIRTDTSLTELVGDQGVWSDTIRLLVTDEFGNPVANVPVHFEAGEPSYDAGCTNRPVDPRNLVFFELVLNEDGTFAECPLDQLHLGSERHPGCGFAPRTFLTRSDGRTSAGVILGDVVYGTYRALVSAPGLESLEYSYIQEFTTEPNGECTESLFDGLKEIRSGLIVNEGGSVVSAARAGEAYGAPLRFTLLQWLNETFAVENSDGTFRAESNRAQGFWLPVEVGGAIVETTVQATGGGFASDWFPADPSTLETVLTTGPEPGENSIEFTFQNLPLWFWQIEVATGALQLRHCTVVGEAFCAVNQGNLHSRSGSMGPVYGLEPIVAATVPPHIVLSPEERTTEDLRVIYGVEPGTFPQVPAFVYLLRDGELAAFTRGNTSAGLGEASFDRGLGLDLDAVHEVQLVLNPGSVAEVRSDPVELVLSQQIFRDVPSQILISRDVDLVNQRSCSQPSTFSFTTTQEATITLSLRRVEAEGTDGEPELGEEIRLIDGEVRA
ncbi:MAG: hypothetical protein KDD47_19570, partial [Acidobacteria bacterium]|nr:hypothetical protein [Acidobacteriota bacterium]